MSAIGSQLANTALQSMYNPSVQSAQDQCRIGLSYEHDIQQKCTDPMDRLVSTTALNAYDSVEDVYSGLGVLNKSRNAISTGVQGPIGTALAQIGTNTMFNSHQASAQDQCRVGLAYDKAIVANAGDPTQTLLANTTLAAYDAVDNVYSGLGVLSAGLNAEPTAPGRSASGVLATVGESAMHNADVASAQDQCKIGLVFTKAVRDNSTDAAQRTQAQAALDAYDKVDGVYSGLEVLDNFLKAAH